MKRGIPMRNNEGEFSAIEIAASGWLIRQEDGLTAAEERDLQQWLEAAPEHGVVYARMRRTWEVLDRMDQVPRPARFSPSADFGPAVKLTRRPFPVAHWQRRWKTPAALAAAAAIVLVGYFGWERHQSLRSIEMVASTEVGGWRTLDLPDGSAIRLNTDTTVNVHYTKTERRVQLTRGEAHFEVAKNLARPFYVEVGAMAVRAVGTAFNVRLRDTTLDLVVTEGVVRVDRVNPSVVPATLTAPPGVPVLSAGQRVLLPVQASAAPGIGNGPEVITLGSAEIDQALAWKDRRLKFVAQPLSEVVAEFNRYNQHKLMIDDPELAAQRFGGIFRPDRYHVLIDMLEQTFGVEAHQSGGMTVLRRKSK